MATGNPTTSHRRLSHNTVSGSPSNCSLDVIMAYEGKKPESDVLMTPPAKFTRLWPKRVAKDATDNRLYFGNNLSTLSALVNDSKVCGKVKLVYIDPPYATKKVFESRKQIEAYTDLLEGAHYLEFLRARLIFLRKLLADDGSIYVHLDENMAFHAKIIMDEIFGRSNFRNWITRKKCNPKNYTRKTYGNVADYILFYTKSEEYVWHRPMEFWTQDRAAKEYQYIEPETRRRYKKVPVHAPGIRNGKTGQPWRGKLPPPGKHWQYPPSVLDEMDARGEIYWSPTGNPRRKIYFDQSNGVPVQDIWMDFRDAYNQNICITGYPTEKNSSLIQRIIEASSSEGDLVLDSFSGSGTTLDVAHGLKRRWIGIDNSVEAIKTTLARFADGLEPMGDFVNIPEKTKVEEPMLPMLELSRCEEHKHGNGFSHYPIRDFCLYASEPHNDCLLEVLTELEMSNTTRNTRYSTGVGSTT